MFGYVEYTIIINFSNESELINEYVYRELKRDRIDLDSFHAARDWIVTEAISRVTQINIENHYRHDLYICIFDRIGQSVMLLIDRCFKMLQINFSRIVKIKTLITNNALFLTKIEDNERKFAPV